MEFKEGDHVLYYPTGAEQNPTSGVIEKCIFERQQVGSQVVQASEEMPRYVSSNRIIFLFIVQVIKNDKTGKETTYKLENIIKKLQEGASGMQGKESENVEGVEEEEEEVGEEEVYNPAEESAVPEEMEAD